MGTKEIIVALKTSDSTKKLKKTFLLLFLLCGLISFSNVHTSISGLNDTLSGDSFVQFPYDLIESNDTETVGNSALLEATDKQHLSASRINQKNNLA